MDRWTDKSRAFQEVWGIKRIEHNEENFSTSHRALVTKSVHYKANKMTFRPSTGKSVNRVSDQVSLKTVFSSTETS